MLLNANGKAKTNQGSLRRSILSFAVECLLERAINTAVSSSCMIHNTEPDSLFWNKLKMTSPLRQTSCKFTASK